MVRGIPKSMFSPIAAPRTSASAVETEARMAVRRNNLLVPFLKNFVEASERQSPVTIPRCAALC
jgi:hypothetical protein